MADESKAPPMPPTPPQDNSAEEDLEMLKSQLSQMTDTCRRTLADLANYKKFVEEQRKHASWYGTTEILKDLLAIIDNFDRAREHMRAAASADGGKELSKEHREGIDAIARQLTAILEKNRVQKIETIGKPFDATQHEVLSSSPGPESIIVEEFEKGYTIAGQVLRPAKVIVGNGQKAVE